jgi:hypothetical protein
MAKGYEETIARSSKGANQVFPIVDESERGHNSYTYQKERPRPDRPHLRDLDVNEFAYQPMQTQTMLRGQSAYHQVQHDTEVNPAVGLDPQDDEMLDGYATFEPTAAEYADATPDHAFVHMYAPSASEAELEFSLFRYDRPSTRARDVPWSRSGTSAIHRDTSSYPAAAEQGLLNEEDHVGDRDFEDGLEGFWRPNRLY